MPVDKPCSIRTSHDLLLLIHLRHLTDQSLHNILQRNDTLYATELIRHDTILNPCLLKLRQGIIDTLVLRDKLRGTHYLTNREIGFVDAPEEVFQIDYTDNIIKILRSDRINIEQVFLHLFLDLLRTVGHVEPNQFTSMRHDRTDITVSQVENTLYNILFNLLYLATIKAFLNNCLDLLFCHLILLFCIDA